MKRVCLFLLFGFWMLSSSSQSTLPGYSKAISGETLSYYSYTPMASEALLTRCNTGEMAIEWLTSIVPADFNADFAYFTWTGGNSSGTSSGKQHFDLYINGKFYITIETDKHYEAAGWNFTGADGTEIHFIKKGLDKNNDMSGDVTLKVPKALITPGKALQLKIVGKKEGTADWLMVYKHVPGDRFMVKLLPLLTKGPNGDTLRQVKLFGEYTKAYGQIVAYVNGVSNPFRFDLQQGYNEFEISVPYKTKLPYYIINSEIQGKRMGADTVTLTALIPLEVHMIHHSHTDVGYSHLQETVAEIHNENIRQAIDLIDKTKNYPFESQFRWNIESTWAVENFLDSSNEKQIAKFREALNTGRMNIAGYYTNNLSGIMRGEEFIRLTDYARKLEREFGITINSAMITDIPGYTMSLVKAMQMAGIKYFSVGPNNSDRIGTVLEKWGDKPFYWKAPGSNEKVMTIVSGDSYAWFHSIGGAREPRLLNKKLIDYINIVNENKYPYRYLALRYNIFSDNAPLDPLISDFVRDWNNKYIYPKLVLSTPQMVMQKIEKDFASKIPVVDGDMTPYWEDGAASSAAELALNKSVAERVNQTEKLWSLLKPVSFPSLEFYKVWSGVLLFDEHTWGAWSSISDPDIPFSVKQWDFKRNYVLDADKKEKELKSAFLNHVSSPTKSWSIVNTNSWNSPSIVLLKDLTDKDRIMDEKGRVIRTQQTKAGKLVYVPDVPALGSTSLKVAPESTPTIKGLEAPNYSFHDNIMENKFVRVLIDSKTGAISSFILKATNTDIVKKGQYQFNQYLYVPGRDPATAVTSKVKVIRLNEMGVYETDVTVVCEAEGTSGLSIRYRLNNISGALTIENHLEKTKVRTKEAVHFAFPFNIANGKWKADNGFLAYDPLNDTIPGNNKDFTYCGKWADLSNKDWGVTYFSPDAPIIEFGEMNSEVIPAGKGAKVWKSKQTPSQLLFSYALNNYWHTNYKADQEGPVSFTYTILPHGKFSITDAYKRAEEIYQPPVLIQTDKIKVQAPLIINNEKVVVSTLVPAKDGNGIVVRLYNTSQEKQQVSLKTRSGKLVASNLYEDLLPAISGEIILLPFETRTFRLLEK